MVKKAGMFEGGRWRRFSFRLARAGCIFLFLFRIQFDEIESRVLDSRSFPRRDLSPIDFLEVDSFDDAELDREETSGRVTDFRSAPC